MNLQTALSALKSPKGAGTLIENIMSGDYHDLNPESAIGIGIDKCLDRLAFYEEKIEKCQSDAAYWGYLADLTYWRAACKIYEAAEITGDDNLPDVELPSEKAFVVMDIIAEQDKFGERVLNAAKFKDIHS